MADNSDEVLDFDPEEERSNKLPELTTLQKTAKISGETEAEIREKFGIYNDRNYPYSYQDPDNLFIITKSDFGYTRMYERYHPSEYTDPSFSIARSASIKDAGNLDISYDGEGTSEGDTFYPDGRMHLELNYPVGSRDADTRGKPAYAFNPGFSFDSEGELSEVRLAYGKKLVKNGGGVIKLNFLKI